MQKNSFLQLADTDILSAFEAKYVIPRHPKLDNEAYYAVYESTKRYNLIYGGRGSAKSVECSGKLPIVLISCLPFCRILFMRKIENTHRLSTFQEIVDYIERFELTPYFKITTSPLKIVHIATGNSIVFKGFDKPNSIKSIKDITHVFFEEAFEIEDWNGIMTVDKSVRTRRLKIGYPHKIYFMFNPDNVDHWLHEVFFDDEPENVKKYAHYRKNAFYLKTTYRDNKFIPQVFVELIEADKISNPEKYEVDGLGNWGRLKKTGLFYRYFNFANTVERNLKKRVYSRTAPLHISFDFNVYPYVTLEVTQLHYNESLGQLEVCTIDEICLTSKEQIGDVKATCVEFLRRYKDHVGDVVVCGDRAGHSKKTNAIPDFATVFNMLTSTPKNKYQQSKDSLGRVVTIDPYPEYEEFGCKFNVVDNTIKTQNPQLVVRQRFFEILHQEKMKVLPAGREYGTINASGQKRLLSTQYPNVKIVQKIDEVNCPFLIRDYSDLKEDVVKGGKDTRKKELSHTSDAMDYQYCQLFTAELNLIAKELKI